MSEAMDQGGAAAQNDTDGAGAGDGQGSAGAGAGQGAPGAEAGSGNDRMQSSDAGGGGDRVRSWLDGLPDDIRGHEGLKGFKDAGEMAKAYLELQGEGARGGEAAPGSVEGYEFKPPEGQPVDEAFVTAAKSWAHDMGLSNRQWGKLVDRYMAYEAEAMKGFEARQEKAHNDLLEGWKTELRSEWGSDFETNVQAAEKAAMSLAGEEGYQFLQDNRVTCHPVMVRMFHRLSRLISEDAFAGGGPGAAPREIPRTPGGMPSLDFPSMER